MLNNWVKESVDSAPGTGTIDLGGAETGFISFADAYASGATVYYTVEDGNNRESGIGTFTNAATDTLSRDTVLETLSSGTYDNTSPSAISLTSAAVVSISADANVLMPGFHEPPGALGVALSNTCYSTVNDAGHSPDVVYARPIEIRNKATFTKISFQFTATAGTKIRAGVYDSSNAGFPGNLLASTNDITPTTALIEASLISPIILNPGIYYLAWVEDGDNTCKSNSRSSLNGLSGIAASNDGLGVIYLKVSAPSWSALPDPFGTASHEVGVNPLRMRIL